MSEPRDVDVVILGGGPAGLTAAIYAARNNRKVLVIEREQYGGQLAGTEAVENFPGFKEPVTGWDLSENMRAQAERFGTEFLYSEAKSIELRDDGRTKVVVTGEGEVRAKALILATGSRPRTLGAPGEKEWWGRGISTCATCDGAFFRGKEVVVVGGGDAAVEEGTFLTNFASKVTIVHRRDQLRATPVLQQRAFDNEKIEFVWDSEVAEYIGTDKLEGVKIKNVKTGEESELRVPGVFIFIGHIPNTAIVKELLELDSHGLIKADPTTKTSIPGVYAAGDLRTGAYMQAVTAAADGCMAAINAEHYIGDMLAQAKEATTA